MPHRGHLLVVDDDAVNREVLRAQLEPAGYRITTARDGREAVQALKDSTDFDGVLLDVMMPKMTGPEAARIMRVDHPHGTLPIVMVTAKSRPEDAAIGLEAGASDYVGKPFHREELLQRLDGQIRAVRTARAFRRFVPEDFLALLGVSDFAELKAGVGIEKHLTMLFTDIRNFTTLSERLGPEATFRFVNGCFSRFEPVIRAHGGFIDKFIGDAVMAIFPGDAENAVRAAADLQKEVANYNAAKAGAKAPLAIGIGLHRGPVMIGTVGDADRMEVTAIGDTVNVSARLESLTKALGVVALVSEETLEQAPRELGRALRRVGAVRVKGRDAAIDLFEILDCVASADERDQKEATRDRFQTGLIAYMQGDLTRAQVHFEAICEAAPLDSVSKVYLARVHAYQAAGLPEHFDGDLGHM